MSVREFVVFFFNDTATTEIYTLSLHDALPILRLSSLTRTSLSAARSAGSEFRPASWPPGRWGDSSSCSLLTSCARSEEHTSELQSRQYLVCRLLLEKKQGLLLELLLFPLSLST